MTNTDYFELLEKARKIDSCVSCIAIDKDGNRLDQIVPDCYLYVACGEDTIVYVNEHMKINEIQFESSYKLGM